MAFTLDDVDVDVAATAATAAWYAANGNPAGIMTPAAAGASSAAIPIRPSASSPTVSCPPP